MTTQSFEWLSTGDMLLATPTGIDSNNTGQFLVKPTTSNFMHLIFVGAPVTSPARPGSYYAQFICQRVCADEQALFSSRSLSTLFRNLL